MCQSVRQAGSSRSGHGIFEGAPRRMRMLRHGRKKEAGRDALRKEHWCLAEPPRAIFRHPSYLSIYLSSINFMEHLISFIGAVSTNASILMILSIYSSTVRLRHASKLQYTRVSRVTASANQMTCPSPTPSSNFHLHLHLQLHASLPPFASILFHSRGGS